MSVLPEVGHPQYLLSFVSTVVNSMTWLERVSSPATRAFEETAKASNASNEKNFMIDSGWAVSRL
jgi:hypothetical protein